MHRIHFTAPLAFALIVVAAGGPLAGEASADAATNQQLRGDMASLRLSQQSSSSVRFIAFGEAWQNLVQPTTFSDRVSATFRVVPGLSDPSLISFESLNRPGRYLAVGAWSNRHGVFILALSTALTWEDRAKATFDARPGLSGQGSTTSFESVSNRGMFLQSRWLRLSRRRPRFLRAIIAPSSSASERVGASFFVTPPQQHRVALRSANFPDRYVRHRNYLGELTEMHPADVPDATFAVVRGISDLAMVSLEATNLSGHFLRHQNFRVRLDHLPSIADHRDATFRMVAALDGGGGVSFESYNFPGCYLRHRDFHLWVEQSDGSTLFKADASFAIAEPIAQ